MSISIEDVKKFLKEKAKEANTATLQVDSVAGTTDAEQYKINFIKPEPKKEEPKKKTSNPKSKG